jgi:hypothetical protein
MLLRHYVSSHSVGDGCIKCQVWTDLFGCETQCLVASSMVGLLGLEVNTENVVCLLLGCSPASVV